MRIGPRILIVALFAVVPLRARAFADAPRPVDDYVVLGVHEVDLGDGSYVAAGSVGVNAPGGLVTVGGEVFMPDGSAVTGDVVAIGDGASVFDLFSNDLPTPVADVVVRGAGPTPFAPGNLVLPPLPTFAPGATPVSVLFADTVVLPPGAYGPVSVSRKGLLVLTGGVYELQSLDVQEFAAVHVQGPATIDIRDDLKIAAFTHMGPSQSGVGARDVRVNVGGDSVRFGNTSHAMMDLLAPHARVLFSRSFRGEGRFIGDVIQGDETLNLRLTLPATRTAVGTQLCTLTQEIYGAPAGASNPLLGLLKQNPDVLPVTIGAPGINSLTVVDARRLTCFLPTSGFLASLCLRLGTCPVDTVVDTCDDPPILDFDPSGDGASGGLGAGTLAGEVIAAKLNVALSTRGATLLGLGELVLPQRLCTTKCPRGREVNPNPMRIQTGAVGVADGITTVGGLVALADQALGVSHCRPGTCVATSATAIFPPNPVRMSDIQNALEVVNQCFRGCATLVPCSL